MCKMAMLSKNAVRMFLGFFTALYIVSFSNPVYGLEKTYTNALGMTFVLISPGTFTMGSPPGEPFRGSSETQHQVTISKPFYMQTTEFTLKQWQTIMGHRKSTFRKVPDNIPVTRVSWFDCMDLIKRLNRLGQGKYRLPTEAEWEYAARAGTSTAYSWGDTIDCDKAMYGNNRLKDTECQQYIKSRGLQIDQPAPVKSYAPNAWGLYDMLGNVWEWCSDWFGKYQKTKGIDPTGSESGSERVRRGGSWFKYGYSCRSANRSFGHPATRYQTTGFRLVKEIQ